MRACLPMRLVRARAAGFRRWAAVAVVAGLGVLLTACGSDSSDADLPAVEGPASPRVEVRATEMSYEPDAVAVESGDVEVVMHNDGNTLHDLRIDEEPLLVEATPGDTATGEVQLDPGSYQFYCSISGHREAGMEGVLEVR